MGHYFRGNESKVMKGKRSSVDGRAWFCGENREDLSGRGVRDVERFMRGWWAKVLEREGRRGHGFAGKCALLHGRRFVAAWAKGRGERGRG